MINRFALSFLCIELDRDKTCGVMLLYILLSSAYNDAKTIKPRWSCKHSSGLIIFARYLNLIDKFSNNMVLYVRDSVPAWILSVIECVCLIWVPKVRGVGPYARSCACQQDKYSCFSHLECSF